MTNRVRNKEIPTKTVFGGVWPVPRAWRNSDMTIIILTKEVIIINNDGNNVSTVIRTSICRVRLYSDAPDASVVTETAGRPWARRGVAGAIKISDSNA